MVVGAISHQLVAVAHEALAQGSCVGLHLLLVSLELRGGGILESHGQCADLVVVGPTLQGGEHREVDLVLVVVLQICRLALLECLRRLDALRRD